MISSLDIIRGTLAGAAGVDPRDIADDTPLVESGLLTSLQAVELLDLVESLTGRSVDVASLGPECFRDLRSISERLLGEPGPHPRPAQPLRGAALTAFRRFDALIADAALADGATEELHAPSLPLDVLRRAGWLASFPHLATLAAPIAAERRASVAADENVSLEDLARPATALPPASCHAIYAARAGSVIAQRELVTVQGPCWRAEATEEALVRQRCFTMREIVVLGSPADAETFVETWARRLPALAEALGLAAGLRPASDPFFDPTRDPKARAQALLGPVKRELVDARGVALASVNLHRSFFSGAFGIEREAGACWSACVAFGLERWTGALLAPPLAAQPRWDAAAEALR